MEITQENIKATFTAIQAVMDCVKAAKEVPCGTMYAGLMALGCTLDQYQRIEQICINTGLVGKVGDCLIWVEEENVECTPIAPK